MQSSASPHLLTRVSQDQSMLVTGVTEVSHLVSLVPQRPLVTSHWPVTCRLLMCAHPRLLATAR